MSLEDLLSKNNELLAEHNDLLRQVLGSAKANKGGKAADEGGEKATRRSTKKDDAKGDSKDDDGGSEGLSDDDKSAMEASIKKAGAWLGEFKANEKDPETEARKSKLREALDKLGYKLAKEIDKGEDVQRFVKWIDKQAKAGRITPEPGDGDGDGDGEGDDI